MEAIYKLRHVATLMAVHGFQHKLCNIKMFHTPHKTVNANYATNSVKIPHPDLQRKGMVYYTVQQRWKLI